MSLAHSALVAALAAATTVFGASAQVYKTEVFIPGSGMHGIHGITFDAEDRMFVGSVLGQSVYEVNAETGQHRVYAEPPEGMADDLEFDEDGTLFWTSFAIGRVHARKNFGPVREIAGGLPGINSIAFNAEGRLFATQVFLGDVLWELDPLGAEQPRKIMENMGGLNGFDFGPDGYLYGPLWFKGAIAKVDVDKGKLEIVMEGFKVPAAANFDSKGNLWVLDSALGQLVKVDVEKKTRVVFPGLPTAMDNLAIDSNDQVWFTVMPENAVYRFDEDTGEAHAIRRDEFAVPCDLQIIQDGDRELLYVTDIFAVKVIDLATKEVKSVARTVESNIQYPSGVLVTDDRIYLASWFSNTLQILDRRTGEELDSYEAIKGPTDVIELEDGRIGVLRLDGYILHVDGYQAIAWNHLSKIPNGGTSIVYAGNEVAYGSATNSGVVYELDLVNRTSRMMLGGIDRPEGLALSADGKTVFVAEVGKQAVSKVDLNTGDLVTIGVDIPMGLKMPEFLPKNGPLSGIAIASDGSIYVASDVEGAIYKLTPIETGDATD